MVTSCGTLSDFEMGRPPGIPNGADQRFVAALTTNTVFRRAGGYRIVVELDNDGKTQHTYPFRIIDVPAPGVTAA